MISIDEYLEQIYEDMRRQIENGEQLCELKDLTFEAGSLPDYTNVQIQRLYLLRYAFAYAFEYELMYRAVLSDLEIDNEIMVASIGCGTMIDYWALAQVIEKQRLDYGVRYIGIDTIDWQYRFEGREGDSVRFVQRNAEQMFRMNRQLMSDVYFFPKSISEFSEREMDEIVEKFRTKPIYKDVIFVCISLRANEASMQRDLERTRMLIEALEDNGFSASQDCDEYCEYSENVGIIACDNSYCYPEEVLQYISNLNRECEYFSIWGENCDESCLCLNRFPVLKTGLMRYQVIKFERV